MSFNGKLYCRGSSRIGGRIEGEVVSEGLLIIEEEALITAEIIADEAIIQGRVQGKLVAKGRVELTASCHYDGDIETPCLIINEGAMFNGRCLMSAAESDDANPRIVANGEDDHGDVAILKVPEVNVTN